jgi:hypothetical protein
MCSKEEVHEELRKCEARIMEHLHKELESLRTTTQESVIDRNSVHMLLERMKEDNTRTHTLAEQILAQTTKTNGRVTNMEEWRAVHIKETEHMKEAVATLGNYLRTLNWIVIVGVVGAVLTLVLQ